jgi:hypothetical protein
MDIRKTYKENKNFKILFESDVYRNELLDTIVFIDQIKPFTISGNEIDNFTKEFNLLIAKYRI